MANGHGGRRPGSGRPKGGKDKAAIRILKELDSAPVQFMRSGYDPLAEMIALAQQPVLSEQDILHLDIHKSLARKYFPDVAAVKVSGDPDAPIVFEVVRTSYTEYVDQHKQVTNGHGKTSSPAV